MATTDQQLEAALLASPGLLVGRTSGGAFASLQSIESGTSTKPWLALLWSLDGPKSSPIGRSVQQQDWSVVHVSEAASVLPTHGLSPRSQRQDGEPSHGLR